jgi:hypothetical protein
MAIKNKKSTGIKTAPPKPKQKEVKVVEEKIPDKVLPEVIKKKEEKKVKEKKYHKLSSNASKTEFQEVGQKVQKGELKWVFYALDGDIGYHHYEILV